MTSLHPEILDLIVELLHNEPETLKACCIVSKAWIYRTRRHLFNQVKFRYQYCHVSSWRETFPDPQNSPAHHTRILSIYLSKPITAADANTLLTFFRISHLGVDTLQWHHRKFSLLLLHSFSPTIRSLHLTFSCPHIPEIFDLICSFPVLEDLSLAGYGSRINSDVAWNAPSTSPRLAGSLELRGGGAMRLVADKLLDLPNGLQFEEFAVQWFIPDGVRAAVILVSRCSKTLRSLKITNYLEGTLLRPWFSSDNFSPLRVDPFKGMALDLSKATKLKDLEFGCRKPNVKWISAVLRAAQVKNLRSISLVLSRDSARITSIWELSHHGWVALDCLLVQLWTSYLLRPKLMYDSTGGGGDLGCDVARLLPDSTRGGIIDIVEGYEG